MSVKPLVIFDLDGTLIWATRVFNVDANPDTGADFIIQVYGETWSVRKRPGLDAFLEWCHQHFRLAVWTAARPAYAQAISEHLFRGMELEFIFSRPETQIEPSPIDGDLIYRKPLRRIWFLPFRWFHYANTRIIDDTPETYAFNEENAIPIVTWTEDAKDVELLRIQLVLAEWLEKIKAQDE